MAYIRPDPPPKGGKPGPKRFVWELIHHNLGRAAVLLAWANLYIGIVVYHNDWEEEYAPWIAPIAIVMGLLVSD